MVQNYHSFDVFWFWNKLKTIRKYRYCKSGNICGTLIFAYFAQIQQARIQKPAKILYAHFGHVGSYMCWCKWVIYSCLSETCFVFVLPRPSYIHTYMYKMYHSLNDVNIVQYQNDKWASAQREFNNPRMFLCCQTRKFSHAKITAFTVYEWLDLESCSTNGALSICQNNTYQS